MQVKKILCFVLCLVFFLSSCAKEPKAEQTSATAVSTTEEESTVVFPSKLTHESTTIGDYGTVDAGQSEKYKVFIRKDWNISKEFWECYYNPENKEEPYNRENRFGIADKNGNIIIEPQFGLIYPAANDRFIVANGKKDEYSEFYGSEYAVINSKGEFIIPFVPHIEEMIDYSDGLKSNYFCVCNENGEYYIADNNGNMVYDMYFTSFRVAHPKYNYSDKLHNGVCGGKSYYFDQKLNIIKILDDKPVVNESLYYTHLNMEYAETICFKDGEYYYGVINETTGKEIVPCKYDKITRFADDRILAVSDTDEYVVTSGGSMYYGDIIAIYDFYGNILCSEGTYHSIEFSNYKEETNRSFEAVGVATAPNPNGDRIYGEHYEWLIDKNGIKISDKYYSIYYNSYGEMAGYYTADRGDRVFYLNKRGKIVGAIGQ